MLKAIYFKEWVKTRIYIPIALVVSLGMVGYTILRLVRVCQMQGVDHLWEILLSRDVVFIETMRYLPLLLGVVLAAVQFVPEIAQKRLKLTLHLPYPAQKMILQMLGYGVAVLVVLFAVQYAILWGYLQSILARELVSRILLTSFPWYICGLNLYFITAWVVLEPTWKRRFVYILMAIGIVRIYFLAATPQAYDGFIPIMLLFTACTLFFPLLSVSRFRRGCQD